MQESEQLVACANAHGGRSAVGKHGEKSVVAKHDCESTRQELKVCFHLAYAHEQYEIWHKNEACAILLVQACGIRRHDMVAS
jgi:hypothetical protein